MTVPLHYHSGTYHVFVHVGSPNPQRQTLILDTGSRFLAFPCEPWCRQCGQHHSSIFNSSRSNTLRINTPPNCTFDKSTPNDGVCSFHQKYVEGSSWIANEMEDLLWLGTWDYQESLEEYMPHGAIPFTFGCQTSLSGHFAKQYADGILGLSRSLEENAFLNSLIKGQVIDRAAFAICLTREGGSLSLGGSGLVPRPEPNTAILRRRRQLQSEQTQQPTVTQFHLEPMSFATLQMADHGYYTMKILQVYLDYVCLTCTSGKSNPDYQMRERVLAAFQSGRGALLDSGTTDTFFPRKVYKIFAQTWQSLAGKMMREKQRYTYDQFRRIPDIKLVLEPNTTLVIPASTYMEGVPVENITDFSHVSIARSHDRIKPWTGTRQLTMRVYLEENNGVVLGANAMINYDILYDLQSNRIGFARSYCGH